MLGPNANGAVGTLTSGGALVDRPSSYSRPHSSTITGANHDHEIRLLTIHKNVETSPFGERLLDVLASYIVGARIIERLAGIWVG